MAAYPEAVERLLRNATAEGAMVIRDCFDPAGLETGGRWLDVGRILPDGAALAAGTQLVAQWWQEHGIAGKVVQPPRGKIMKLGSGFSQAPHHLSYNRAINGYASIRGRQELFVSPGLDRMTGPGRAFSPEVEALDMQVLAERRRLLQRHQIMKFSGRTILQAGDIALVMGQPVPAYTALRARRPVSAHAGFTYGLRDRARISEVLLELLDDLKQAGGRNTV
jgi:hypothetical protein